METLHVKNGIMEIVGNGKWNNAYEKWKSGDNGKVKVEVMESVVISGKSSQW